MGMVRTADAALGWLALILLLAVPLPGYAQYSGSTVRHYKIAEQDKSFPPELTQAEDDIEKQNYTSAEPLLLKVVGDNPNNYQAWFDLGFVYNALGRVDESIAAYRKSVTAKPSVFESNLNLGLVLAKSGQPDAEQFLRAATELTPTAHPDEGHYRAWLSLGHVLERSKPDEAITAFQRAAALEPKETDPYLSAGPLLEQANRFADAEQQYKQVLAIDPQSADALIGLANIYVRGHRFGEAEAALRKLAALHPNDANVHIQLGRILAADGQSDAAIAEIQNAIKIGGDNPAAERDLAALFLSAAKYHQAEAQYRALVATDANDAQIRYGLGQALLKERRFPEAEQQLQAAIQLKPDFGEAYGDLAIAASENKDYRMTIQALDLRAKFLPDVPVTYFLRATAYDHLRDHKQAAENYHKFLDTDNGRNSDQEWQARHRLIAIEK
jgi:tetratricopeptide (TPR) repeat protein